MSDAARHPNAALIARFYDALGRRDAATMIACYAPDATFSDPVFPALDAAGVAAMWEMLCARGKDLAVVASDIAADAESGRAHWVATYTFSGTGRTVENRIDARFTFRDGRIVRHEDRFDLRGWLRQALGFKGALLGWLPAVQNATRAQAAKALADWRGRNATADLPRASEVKRS
ncbi:MAG TPA: nuclear transport factor 2 family protein [Casimicrobiaceae bacterium]|nr:nuclear transport factor 2 family protein [Casimicrobiaceae bacterium]